MEKVEPGKGYDYTLTGSDGPAPVPNSAESRPGDTYEIKVKIRRLGEFKFPVEVEFVFENGEKIRENWDGQDLWKEYRFLKPAQLESVAVDPDRKIPLDVNFANKTRKGRKQLQPQKSGNEMLQRIKFMLDPDR